MGLLGFRPFLWNDDQTALWTVFNSFGAITWSSAPPVLNATSGVDSEGWFIRNTDEADTQVVEVATTNVLAGGNACQMGVIANYQSSVRFYLLHARTNGSQDLRLLVNNSGFTQVASKSFTLTAGTEYVLKITSVTDGTNKDLEGWVDGVQELTATTAVRYGSERAAIYSHPLTGSADCNSSYFSFNTRSGMVLTGVGAP